jgi:hypothetical protein
MREEIKVHLEDPDANPFLGCLWVAQRFERGVCGADKRLHRLFELEKSGRHTLTYYLDALSRRHDELAATGSSWTLPSMSRHFKSVFRRQRQRLWADDLLWGKTGYWLVHCGDFRQAAQWLADWPNRRKLESWMIYNLALALEVTERPHEALPVLRHGLGLPQEAALYLSFAVLTAFEEALSGNLAEAKNLIAGADTEQAGGLEKVIMGFTGALCLGLSEEPMDPRARRRLLKQEIRGATGKLAPARLHELARSCYRRMIRRLAAQPGLSRLKVWAWWNSRRGDWIWVGMVALLTPFLLLALPVGPLLLYFLWRRLLK